METGKNEHINRKDFSKENFEHLTADEKIDIFVRGYRVPQKRNKAQVLDMLREKIEQKNTTKPIRSLRVYWSAAASIAVIALLSGIYFHFTPNQIIADRGKHIEYALPDGSNITINADSKISYSKLSFTGKRVLKLEGEAFFSVQKGKPFWVNTKLGTVEVLGTSFNVYVRDNEFNVSCLTGKVSVSANGHNVIIEPGEKAELEAGTLKKIMNVPTNEMAGWRTGEFHFDNIPLISIFDEIERQFNVSISAEGIGNRYFTGSFANKDLTEVLETVCLPMRLEYEIKDGNKISIKPQTK